MRRRLASWFARLAARIDPSGLATPAAMSEPERPYPGVVVELPLEGYLRTYVVGTSQSERDRTLRWAAETYSDLLFEVLVASRRDENAES